MAHKTLGQVLQQAARPQVSITQWAGKAINLKNGEFWSSIMGSQSSTGVAVTVDKALRVSTVWSCVRLIAETIATMPLGLYRRLNDGGRVMVRNDSLYTVLRHSPNHRMTAVLFWEAVVASMLLRGNAYVRIHRSAGVVIGLEFLLPQNMRLDTENGQIIYWLQQPGKEPVKIPERDMMHIPAFSLDGQIGLSPISYGADIFGSAIAADAAAGSTFKNGLMPTVAFKVDRLLKQDQRDDFRKYVETVSGAMNAGKSPVLEQGVSPTQIGINPSDAQLLESRGWSVEEVCRFFRVPPWMIGHTEKSTSWGTGFEQQMIAFVTFVLAPWLNRIEQAIYKDLLPPEKKADHYAEYALEGLLRADSQARSQFYSTMSQNGIYTRDDCREKENLPRKGGNADVLTVQSNLLPLDRLGENNSGEHARQAMARWLESSRNEETDQ